MDSRFRGNDESAEPTDVLPVQERHPVPRHGAGIQKRTKPNQRLKP